MAFPTVAVRAAWSSDPFAASPSWTATDGSSGDLTRRLMKATVSHNRQHTLAQFERARATFTFWNDDRRLDPKFTTGPYGSNVKPRKKIQLRATYGGITYDLFTGFIRSIKPGWDGTKARRTCVITAEDAFSVFQRRRLRLGQWPAWQPRFNPRFYYRFNDEDNATVVKDHAPTPHDGTYTGRNKVSAVGPITTDETFTHGALDCGPLLGGATGPSTAGLDGSPFQGGVAIWVLSISYANMSSTPHGVYTAFSQIIDGGTGQLALRITSDGRFRVNEMANVFETGTGLVPADGAWHLLVFMRRGGSLELWVDGVRHVNRLEGPLNYAQSDIHFGEETDGTKAFDGRLAEAVGYYGSIPTTTDIPKMFEDVNFSYRATSLRTDERIWQLLNRMGWPSGDRNLVNAGVHYAQALSTPLDTTYLEHMLEFDRTEGGLFLVAGDGRVTFDKERPTTPPASSFTIGPGTGEIRYHTAPEVELTDDSQLLINEVTVTAPGLPDAFGSDQASITAYGPTGINHATLLQNTEALQTRAANIITRFKNPKQRVASVTLRASDDEANTVPRMLGTALGATVTVKTPDGDSVLSEITGRNHDIDMAGPSMTTTFSLEPW